jgi:hypothetical protein
LVLLGISPLICLGLVPMVFVVFASWLIQQFPKISIQLTVRLLGTSKRLLVGIATTIGVMWISGALMVRVKSYFGIATRTLYLSDTKPNRKIHWSVSFVGAICLAINLSTDFAWIDIANDPYAKSQKLRIFGSCCSAECPNF